MIKLGTQIGFSYGLGMSLEEVYRTMSELGFSSVDYDLMNSYTDPLWQLDDEELKSVMTQRREVMNAHGIVAGQTHSPMDNYWGSDPETKEARWHAQVQAIKAASFLNSPYIVIHPLSPSCRFHKFGMEETKQLNMEFYNFLKPYLEEYNVKAAIENIASFDHTLDRFREIACSTAAELKDYVDTLNSDRFVVCLDVGHCVLGGQDPVNMIYDLGKKYLHVTHIHDNNLLNDDHMIPGAGRLDWYGIGKALNDIGYDDVFNYEADCTYWRYGCIKDRKTLVLDTLRLYAELGKAIVNVK